MKTKIALNNIILEVDKAQTEEFYSQENGFVCTCPHCTTYPRKTDYIRKMLNGFDERLGIDLTKDVGQSMDELMGHDNDDHCLLVVPYYVSGRCFVDGKELQAQPSGPVWPNTIRATHEFSEDLAITIINSTGDVQFEKAEGVLSIWLEYKTEPII